MQPTRRPIRRLAPIVLFIILAVAAGLRFYNLKWDNGIFAHPDERSTVAFYAPTIRWPADPADILDPRASTLNPFWDVYNQTRRSYTYGHFPLYTLVLVADILRDLAPVAASLNLPPAVTQFLATSQSGQGYAQVGRALMALADLFTVYLVFLLGRRLYGLWAGLLAAALSAFTVLQIQLAHFFAVDPVSTTFTLLALYGAILLYDRRSVGAAVITGIGIALAVASKFSALPVAVAPIVAAYLTVTHPPAKYGSNDAEIADRAQTPAAEKSELTGRMVGLVVLSLGLASVIFAVTSPFVLLDFGNFRQAVLVEQGNMVRGIADFPFTRQYRNTLAYWYFIVQQIRWGMWWPLGLLAFSGLAWVIVKTVRGKAQPGEWIVLWWIILYFGPTGLFLAKFMRYMAPVVPLFTLFGAGLVAALWRYRQPDRESSGDQTVEPINQYTNLPSVATIQPPSPPPPSLREKLAKGAAVTLATAAVVGSAFWSIAFVNGIYGTEHTWVTFARWIYANVPDGACIAYEHWDDRMPTDIPEPGGNASAHQYYQPQLPLYDEDTPEKYELLRDTLMNCDYIVLASNRLWRTIPRLPERYPLSSRYYEALFNGELGFEPVYSVETPPRLGSIVLDDQPADESFTVYDHPKPILFQKTHQLSEAEWNDVLGGSWAGAIPGYVGRPTLLMRLAGAVDSPQPSSESASAEKSKSLLLDTPIDQLPVVNDFRWNDLANNSTLAAVLIWWLVVMLIGLIAWPITFLLFNKLPDRGYGLSKSLGLLLVGYVVWISSSLGWPGNRWFTAALAVVICFGISIWIILKQRHQLVRFLGQRRRLILLTEGVFSLIYLFFIYLRLLNPDLWQPWLGGEKMLEIGFLNAILKSEQMPPYDPFFAGGIINYYYYGLFLIDVLIKLTGIRPAIAFNLAVPTLAGLTTVNVFSLATNLALARLPFGHLGPRSTWLSKARPIDLNAVGAGLLAILFIVFIGNLEGAGQLMRDFARLSTSEFQSAIPGVQTLVLSMGGFLHAISGETIATYNYWDPTRVIPATINEFPYFSFLFADLHPHMIGLPFTVLFLSLAYNWLRPAQPTSQQLAKPSPQGKNEPATDKTTQQSTYPTSFQSQPPDHPPPNATSFIQTLNLIPQPPALLRWLALPFVLGAVAVINTWDLPTYLGLMLAIFLLSRYRRLNQPLTLSRTTLLLGQGLLFAAALLAVTYLLYAPFFANYQAIDVGLGLVHTKTGLGQHLKIWGLFLLVIVTWLAVSLLHPATRNGLLRTVSLGLRRWNVGPHLTEIYRKLVRSQDSAHLVGLWGAIGILLIALVLAILGYWVPAYLLPLVAVALILLVRRETSPEIAYLGALTFTGLMILLGVEFFFLRDFLGGGDYYRMNTLFKFFIQVWVIFGLVVAVALPQLWQWAWRWSWPGQLIWRGAVVLLLMASLVYPVLGTRTRVDDRFPGDHNRPAIGTLDGLAYMTVGSFEWPAGSPIELQYDYEAIRWLQENVAGTPVIAEAKVGYYREGGMRVAAYTGLPSVLGGLHQNEQRYSSQVGERDFVVNEFWNTPDPNRALELIDQLGISYIYVGQIERITYGEQVEEKFRQLHQQGVLELVFENEKTKIYKVNEYGSS